MASDSDVVLLGTGLAPLIAAGELTAAGKSVLVLNPDPDFFLEDSELPLEPLLPSVGTIRPPKSAEEAFEGLRPFFPGLIEFFNCHETAASNVAKASFYDAGAPHLRMRNRVWVSDPSSSDGAWERIEEYFVMLEDQGLHPQLLEGLSAARRFPGSPPLMPGLSGIKGMLLPKSFDVDVSRFRNGVLEFVRERLGGGFVVCNASQIELMPGGLRFHAGGIARTVKINDCALAFWTPRLSSWILSQSRQWEAPLPRKRRVRLWEQWSLLSREALDPASIGVYHDMTVWAEFEGAPPPAPVPIERLAVLRPGPILDLDEVLASSNLNVWAGEASFVALADLCRGFLRWDRFSVRHLKPRLLFEHSTEGDAPFFDFIGKRGPGNVNSEEPLVRIVERADGPLADVVLAAQQACEGVLKSRASDEIQEETT